MRSKRLPRDRKTGSCVCETWRREARNYNTEHATARDALDALASIPESIVFPFIVPIGNIIKSYLSLLDFIKEDGVNTRRHKLFGDWKHFFLFECFLDMQQLSLLFYKPAIVLVFERKRDDLFEVELDHYCDKYRLVDLVASSLCKVSVFCGGKLQTSIETGFHGLVIDMVDPYKRVFVKIFTKSLEPPVLVLERYQ